MELQMKSRTQFSIQSYFRHDLPAGVTVFFVALPLCLGIALASGAPLYSGLISGIIGGMLVSLISGSSLSVSGPAAGLTTVVAAGILAHGDFSVFLLAVVAAGLLQILFGLVKFGTIANYFPSAVIKGMLAAIGIILISKQVPLALGYNQADFWTTALFGFFEDKHLLQHVEDLNEQTTRGSIMISVFSFVIILLWKLPFAKKWKYVPAPLVVVVAGVVTNMAWHQLNSGMSLHSAQLVNIPDKVFSAIQFPDIRLLFTNVSIWKDAIVIALLASLETLLCVEAIDKLDKHNRITPVNRELIAQGIGNVTCGGMLGAIPITAVVVRGAANAEAGAKTHWSSFTHGILLLISIVLFPFILNKIPYAALAIILIMTGYNLARPSLFKNMWKLGLKQFLPFLLTILVILATDLLIGVSIGLLISTYFIVQNNFKAEYRIIRTTENHTEVEVIKLNSNVTFLNKNNLRKTLDKVSPYSILIIDGSECNFIDYDILEIISEFDSKAHDRHIEVRLKGIQKVSVTAMH